MECGSQSLTASRARAAFLLTGGRRGSRLCLLQQEALLGGSGSPYCESCPLKRSLISCFLSFMWSPRLERKDENRPLDKGSDELCLGMSPSAMGLAALEVMQAVHRTWTNSKVRMNGKTRLLQWRDMFDIAVKWRR